MTYRYLPREEWSKLEATFRESGVGLPSSGVIAVAEEGEKIIGFAVVQVVNHLEPVWLDENSSEAPHTLRRLIHMCEDVVPRNSGYYAFIADEKVEALAKSFGLEPLDWYVFYKEM